MSDSPYRPKDHKDSANKTEERTDFYFPDWPFNVFIFIVYILGLYIITSLRTP